MYGNNKLTGVLVVVMLLAVPLSPLATGSGTGTVSASESCSFDATKWSPIFGFTGAVEYSACFIGDFFEDDSSLSDSERNQLYHEEAAQLSTGEDNMVAGRSNYLHDIRHIAMSEARVEAVASINDGQSSGVAKSDAREKAYNNLSRAQRNAVLMQEQHALQVKAWYQAYNQSSTGYNTTIALTQNSSGNNIYFKDTSGSNTLSAPLGEGIGLEFPTKNVTLENGSTVEVTTVVAVPLSYDIQVALNSQNDVPVMDYTTDSTSEVDASLYAKDEAGGGDGAEYNMTITARGPESYNSDYVVSDSQDWESMHESTNSTSTYLDDNVGPLVDNMYSQVEAGQFNASELLSATDLERKYAGTSGPNAVLAHALARGYSVNVSVSQSVDTDMDGSADYTGWLVTRAAAPDNGTWQVNKTYDASNFSSNLNFWYVGADGQTRKTELNGTFQFTRATNSSGANVSEWSPESYDYASASNTDVKKQQRVLEIVKKTYEQAEQAAAGGSGGGFGGIPDFVQNNPVVSAAGAGVGGLAIWKWLLA